MHSSLASDYRTYALRCLAKEARKIAIDLLERNQPIESVLNIVKAALTFESGLRLGEGTRGPRDAQGQLLHDKLAAELTASRVMDDDGAFAASRAKKLLFESWFLSECE